MRLRSYRDPINGYIAFTSRDDTDSPNSVFESDLIHHPCVQRLHQISQLHTAWIRYPSARHSRFSHSLGVMELAGEFARTVYTPFYKYNMVNPHPGFETLPSVESVVEVFRIAGLLHDCGHGPFSHIFENVVLIPRFNLTHETIGGLLVTELLGDIVLNIRHSPRDAFEETISPDLIRFLIDPPHDGGETEEKMRERSPLMNICCQLGWLLNWGFANADTLDYLMRDAYHCGTPEYQGADPKRLMWAVQIHPGKGGDIDVSLDVGKSTTAILSYLSSRRDMYSAVYFHEDVRSLEFDLEEVLQSMVDYIDMPNPTSGREALQTYCALTDASMSPSLLTRRVASPEKLEDVDGIQKAWIRYARGPSRWYKWLDVAGGFMPIPEMLQQKILDAAIEFFASIGHPDAKLRLDHQVRSILPSLAALPSGRKLKNSEEVSQKVCWQLPQNLVISRLYSTVAVSAKTQRRMRVRLQRQLKDSLEQAGFMLYSP